MTYDPENPQKMVPQESLEEKRARVLLALKTGTKFGGEVWEKIKVLGIMREEDIEIDEGGWIGETKVNPDDEKRRNIRLGVQEIPSALGEHVIFCFDQLTVEERLMYRLSHEVCHVICPRISDVQPAFARLFSMIELMRQHGQAMSVLGSLEIYRNAGTVVQATEDVVELTNMYIIDPEYLQLYLGFLSDPNNTKYRSVLGLHTLQDKKVAEVIFSTIERGVAAFLKSE